MSGGSRMWQSASTMREFDMGDVPLFELTFDVSLGVASAHRQRTWRVAHPRTLTAPVRYRGRFEHDRRGYSTASGARSPGTSSGGVGDRRPRRRSWPRRPADRRLDHGDRPPRGTRASKWSRWPPTRPSSTRCSRKPTSCSTSSARPAPTTRSGAGTPRGVGAHLAVRHRRAARGMARLRPRRDGGLRQHVLHRRSRPRARSAPPSPPATRTPGPRPRSRR